MTGLVQPSLPMPSLSATCGLLRFSVAVILLAFLGTLGCQREANSPNLEGRWVGGPTVDTTGSQRMILDFLSNGLVRVGTDIDPKRYAARRDTIWVEISPGGGTMMPLLVRGDSLLSLDGFLVWHRSKR